MLDIKQHKSIQFQVDSGATANLILKRYVQEDNIGKTETTLTLYDNQK